MTATVLALPGFEAMVPSELGPDAIGDLSLRRFANGELEVELGTAVAGRPCSLIGSVAPPDEQLTTFLLAADTLKREGASDLRAVLPYLAYARQDEREPRKSLAAAWIGSLLAAAGVDRVVSIDVHSRAAAQLFPIPVESLSPAPLFAAELGSLGLEDPTVVSPDEGAIERCDDVASAAGIARPVAVFRKERAAGGVRHVEIMGDVGCEVVIVDDIIDTGGTLLSCCAELRRRGVKRIVVMATHGLFTGPRWGGLWDLGVDGIFVTDSVPALAENPPARVEVIAAAPILDEAATG